MSRRTLHRSLPRQSSQHRSLPLEVLRKSKLEDPAIDQALNKYAKDHRADDGYLAVVGLVARGAANPPLNILVDVSSGRNVSKAIRVLWELCDLFDQGKLDRIPKPVLKHIVAGAAKHRFEIDEHFAEVVENRGADVVAPFLRKMDMVGPQTAAAIALQEASAREPRTQLT